MFWLKYLYDLEKLYIIFFCKPTISDEQADFSPSTSVFRYTGSYIYATQQCICD